MPRKPIIRSREHFYHVTARANNKENFYLDQNDVWQIFERELSRLQNEFQIVIAAFVLMNNHFHLLMKTPEVDIDRVMYFLMKRVTLEIQRETGRINKIFGGRYKGSLILDHSYLFNVYKYIYLNPVKALIVSKAESYQFSTLTFEVNKTKRLKFKTDTEVIYDLLDFKNFSEAVQWINQGFNEQEHQSIKTGMRKNVFEYRTLKSSGRPIVPKFSFIK